MKKELISKSAEDTSSIGEKLGRLLSGGEFIELTGDLGTGKTTFLKGLAKGIGVSQPISSPTFTISRVYEADGKTFHHFDFYRIDSSDIVALELSEAAQDPSAIVAVEWAEHVADALPKDRLSVVLESTGETERKIKLTAHGDLHNRLLETLL